MGNRLQEIRESKGMSISELSRKSKVSRQTIYSLEADEVDKANLQTLKSLAEALEVRVTDFFIE
jgi:transcriptional regulator with XRE-family HTH domain